MLDGIKYFKNNTEVVEIFQKQKESIKSQFYYEMAFAVNCTAKKKFWPNCNETTIQTQNNQ